MHAVLAACAPAPPGAWSLELLKRMHPGIFHLPGMAALRIRTVAGLEVWRFIAITIANISSNVERQADLAGQLSFLPRHLKKEEGEGTICFATTLLANSRTTLNFVRSMQLLVS